MRTSFLVASITILRHIPVHLKQISHATTTITHHDTHMCTKSILTSHVFPIYSSRYTTQHVCLPKREGNLAMAYNQNIFLHIYTHMLSIDQSLNILIHKIPSEQPGRIEISHMGCP
jgi:hypothetical protein